MSPGLEHSPVELNSLIRRQSQAAGQSCAFQAETRLGTTPSVVTPASSTDRQKPSVPGWPSYKAIVPRLMSVAKTSQGPIIQPGLVGQATTSPGRMSW